LQFLPYTLLHPKLLLASRYRPVLWRHQGEGEVELDDFCPATHSMAAEAELKFIKCSWLERESSSLLLNSHSSFF